MRCLFDFLVYCYFNDNFCTLVKRLTIIIMLQLFKKKNKKDKGDGVDSNFFKKNI